MIVNTHLKPIIFFVIATVCSQTLALNTSEFINKTIGEARAKWKAGQASLAATSAWSDVKKYAPGAVKRLDDIAKQGDPDALNMMGWLYDNGEYGVPTNPKNALQYFQVAADKGNDVAIFNIGTMTYYGRGVTANEEGSFKYFSKAAENKMVVRACVRSAVYAFKKKMSQSQIADWVQCATDKNNPTGFYLRGRLEYQAGRFDTAAIWLQKAADAMEPNAPWLMSRLYSESPGLNPDKILAAGWWEIGAMLNSKKTGINVAGLDNFSLTDEERERANHFASQWVSSHGQISPLKYSKTILDAKE